jgi:pilus assembly protein CpaB
MMKVLVATKAIGLGERLSSGAVAWQDWPQATVQSSYITDATTPDALTNISGNVARSEFVAGEPILDSKLVKTNEGFLSAVLAPGMRGVSVSVTADAASGGFIVPNDHVDVVMSRISDSVQQSQTVLTDVRVLAINSRLGQSGETGAPDPTSDAKSEIFSNTAIATLELNPIQSEIIVNATQAGKLSLVLRSLADSKGSANAAEIAANQAIRMSSPFWTK